MGSFSFGQWVGLGVVALGFIYVAARLVSAAFFKSKQQFETEPQRKNHG